MNNTGDVNEELHFALQPLVFCIAETEAFVREFAFNGEQLLLRPRIKIFAVVLAERRKHIRG